MKIKEGWEEILGAVFGETLEGIGVGIKGAAGCKHTRSFDSVGAVHPLEFKNSIILLRNKTRRYL